MNNRRKALRTLMAGGAGAGVLQAASWQAPVVKSFVIPAHAEMSGFVPAAGGAELEQGASLDRSDDDNLLVAALATVTAPAQAGLIICRKDAVAAQVCVTPNSDGTMADVEVLFTVEDEPRCFTEELGVAFNVPLNSERPLMFDSSGCQAAENELLDALIPTAIAGDNIGTIVLTSLESGAIGSCSYGFNCVGSNFDFNVPPGSCDLTAMDCCLK